MSDHSDLQTNVRYLPDGGRRAYETEAVATIISLFARPGMPRPGISDEDRDNEHDAAKIFYSSLEHFMGDLERAAALSPLRQSQLHELRDAILDYVPNKQAWAEAVSAVRRNW